MFADRPLQIEYACYLLAGDTEVDIDWASTDDGLRHQDGEIELCQVLGRMEQITAHATKLWEERRPYPPRIARYVGFDGGA